MKESTHSITLPYRDELILHFSELSESRKQAVAEIYGQNDPSARELAELVMGGPEPLRRAVEHRIRGAKGWHFFREMVINHNRALRVAGASSQQRGPLMELGLLATGVDEQGRQVATMPAGIAMVFAEEARGHRASMPLLLSTQSEERLDALAQTWGVDQGGSRGETILALADTFRRSETFDAILERLPNEDWLGDALTVLELGGTCFWPQVFGFDAEDYAMKGGDNVVPMMDREMRRQQQEVAERLLELGVLIRFEIEVGKEDLPPMVAVPQELWPPFLDQGMSWLEGWVHQAMAGASHHSVEASGEMDQGDLVGVAKWLCLEADRGRVEVTGEGLVQSLQRDLSETYQGDRPLDLEATVAWLRRLRVLEGDRGALKVNAEKASGLDEEGEVFVEALLSNWIAGASGSEADEDLAAAIGLDSDWQGQINARRHQYADLVPRWMEHEGVEAQLTGAGCLRDPGTAPEEVLQFELLMTIKYAARTKLLWLDALSRLPRGRSVPMVGVVDLLRTAAAYSSFEKIGQVLSSHPAQIYLPFQRSSVLMDPRHLEVMETWVEKVFDRLLVPLGVADRDEEREMVRLKNEGLKVELLPDWVTEGLGRASEKVFKEGETPEPEPSKVSLRAVHSGGNGQSRRLPITVELQELRRQIESSSIEAFDGEHILLSDEGG